MKSGRALSGFYEFVFLHLEPVSTITPAVICFAYPGATWFYNELIPGFQRETAIDLRAKMAILHLANCYMLLGLISSLVFRAVRDALPHDPVAQERIVGASLTALAIADLTHVMNTFVALPSSVAYNPSLWNATTHGNITFTIFLFLTRVAWMAGIGRQKPAADRKTR